MIPSVDKPDLVKKKLIQKLRDFAIELGAEIASGVLTKQVGWQ